MQNHPFISRHACLAAISCPPAPPIALCPLFLRSSALLQVYFNNADVFSLSCGRNLFVNFTATTRKSTSINARPVWPPLSHFFAYHFCEISEFASLPPPPRRSHLTYIQVFDRDEAVRRKGDDPHFSRGNLGMRASRLITIQIDSRQL